MNSSMALPAIDGTAEQHDAPRLVGPGDAYSGRESTIHRQRNPKAETTVFARKGARARPSHAIRLVSALLPALMTLQCGQGGPGPRPANRPNQRSGRRGLVRIRRARARHGQRGAGQPRRARTQPHRQGAQDAGRPGTTASTRTRSPPIPTATWSAPTRRCRTQQSSLSASWMPLRISNQKSSAAPCLSSSKRAIQPASSSLSSPSTSRIRTRQVLRKSTLRSDSQ